jgi:hypothetical protein
MKMNRRKRKRRKKRLAEAKSRRRVREGYLPDSKAVKASEYLYHLKEYHKQHPDMRALIYPRVSSGAQGYNGNLDTYEKVLRRKLKKLNIPVVGCYCEVSSGWILNEDRWALAKAVKKARRYIRKGKPVVIISTSSDRFLRSRDFNTKTNPDVLPTEAEFEKLKKLTRNVPLGTLLHPDMPPRKVRSYQTKWGQKGKGNSGGRPKINKPGYKKKRRIQKLPRVLRLRKKGASWGKINALTGIPKTTAADWVKKYGK